MKFGFEKFLRSVVYDNFFFHLRLIDGVHFQYSLVFLSFLFSKNSYFSWFGSSIPSVICCFPFSIISIAHYPCQIQSLYRHCVSSLPVLGFPNLFRFCRFVFSNFSCDLWNFYLPEHFLSIVLRGIISITNSNCDSASSWEIPVWVFTSAKLFFLQLSIQMFKFSILFSINFMTSPDILFILW